MLGTQHVFVYKSVNDNFHDNVTAKLFADDIKLYTDLSFPNSQLNFQSHLNIISHWSSTWQINISHTKCNTLENGKHPVHYPYSLSNIPIAYSDLVKDLGIHIQPDLQFDHHITNIINRANQRAFLILRSFISRNPNNLIKAFTVYVRPLVEYAPSVWSPSKLYLINSIENLQRRFTKRIPGLKLLSYAERLDNLKIKSLEHKSLISDLVYCYNITHGHSTIKTQDLFTPSNNPSARGHSHRFLPTLCTNNTQQNFFSNRIIKPWNSLPPNIADAKSLHSFKKTYFFTCSHTIMYLTHPTTYSKSVKFTKPTQ